MSTHTTHHERANGVGTEPARRIIASYQAYRDAEQAVDRLSDAGFPVERVKIVGSGLRFVEQVTGRRGYGQAALEGALAGAMVGLLVGWLFAAFNWFDPVVSSLWLVIDGFWFGGLVGALIGLLTHAFTGGRRDFSSIGSLQAERFDVVVDESVADEAARILGQGS